MKIPYDLFTEAFTQKISDYGLIDYDSDTRNANVNGYRKRACAQFNNICLYDLVSYDDETCELTSDIPESEVDEIVDIVSEGMAYQWLKPYFYQADNLINTLNTPDFYGYSPAELLYRITSAYSASKKDFYNMMKDYSYNHGDLTDLSL